jgi:hypothetical protein
MNQEKRFMRTGEKLRTTIFETRLIYQTTDKRTIGTDTTYTNYTAPEVVTDSAARADWEKLYSTIASNRDKLPLEISTVKRFEQS